MSGFDHYFSFSSYALTAILESSTGEGIRVKQSHVMLRLVKTERVYFPETVALMTGAFDTICQFLSTRVNGNRKAEVRRELALIILRYVDGGERNPDWLAELSFRELAGGDAPHPMTCAQSPESQLRRPRMPGFCDTATYFARRARKAKSPERREQLAEAARFYHALARITPTFPRGYQEPMHASANGSDKAERCGNRAERCRAIAAVMRDPNRRAALMALAETYDRAGGPGRALTALPPPRRGPIAETGRTAADAEREDAGQSPERFAISGAPRIRYEGLGGPG